MEYNENDVVKNEKITALKFQDFTQQGDLTFEVVLSIGNMNKIISEIIESTSNIGERP